MRADGEDYGTALHAAVACPDVLFLLLETLLDAGANVNAVSMKHGTVLQNALRNGAGPFTIKTLIKHGACVNEEDRVHVKEKFKSIERMRIAARESVVAQNAPKKILTSRASRSRAPCLRGRVGTIGLERLGFCYSKNCCCVLQRNI